MNRPSTNLYNSNLFQSLDIHLLFDKFSQYYHFNLNADKLLQLECFLQKNDIELFFRKKMALREYITLNQKTVTFVVQQDIPFDIIKTKIKKSHTLSEKELLFTTLTLYSVIQLLIKSSFIYDKSTSSLAASFKENYHLNKVFNELLKLTDTQTKELNLTRHPTLYPLYQEISKLKREARKSITQISSDWSKEGILSSETYDFVDNHFTVPVRSDRYRGSLGHIITRSNTGFTLYVEPQTIAEKVNRKNELEAKLETEKFKILSSFTSELAKHYKIIESCISYLIELDKLNAHLKVLQEYSLSIPHFSHENHIELKQAHHPLIADSIKNDITIKNEDCGVLLSGPNTGGKTVLLKTIALSLFLPSCGFGAPASQATIPNTSQVLFFSNDQQSITDGLSSFSSESAQYLDYIDQITENTFIFIDEIFNSTSSYEASIISEALIDHMLSRRAHIFISSHHDHLKDSIFSNQKLLSAHMGFTESQSTPTYRVIIGTPGKSYAVEIFQSIEKKLFGNLKISNYIGQKETSSNKSEKLKLKRLNELEDSLLHLEKENSNLKNNLKREKDAIKGLLELEKKKLEDDFLQKWTKAKQDLYQLSEEIKSNNIKNIRTISQKVNKINPIAEPISKKENIPTKLEPKNIKVGDNVYCHSYKQTGKVLKVNQSQVYLQIKKMKVWSKIDDLSSSAHEKPQLKNDFIFHTNKTKGTTTLYDARGVRREEFLKTSEDYIYDVLNGDVPYLDIIHGHGDGILKSSLYEMLSRFKELNYDFIEGNQGTTRISLKK